MIENLERLKNVDGLAKIQMTSTQEFFEKCKADGQDLSVWVGELVWLRISLTY